MYLPLYVSGSAVHTTNRPDLRMDEETSSPQGPSKLTVEDVDDATDEQLSTSTPQERSALPAESTQGRESPRASSNNGQSIVDDDQCEHGEENAAEGDAGGDLHVEDVLDDGSGDRGGAALATREEIEKMI